MEWSSIPDGEQVWLGITLTGSLTKSKEILHDRVGITYQTVTEEESIDQKSDYDENISSEKKNMF